MENNFYTEDELKYLGLKQYGEDVLISKKVSIYGIGDISIGNHVRIDDFCVLSGKIEIGDYVHIAVYSAIFAGKTGVKVGDYCGISSKSVIYAESDDYSGEHLTNPMIPDRYRGVITGKVTLGRHAILGSGTTILPGVEIGEGVAVGSMSLVTKSLAPWGIFAGIPCRYRKERSKSLLELEKEMKNAGEI